METTKVATAQSKSQSLRTTIPATFARTLKLKPGDDLEWEIVHREGQFILEVRPASPNKGTVR